MNKSKKGLGFYAGLASCALSLLFAILYGVIFSGISYKEPVFDAKICVILVVAAAAAAAMLIVSPKLADFAPAVLCVAIGISFMMFIKMMIWPISDTAYGIDPFEQFSSIIVCAVVLVLALIMGEAAVYMKKYRK